MFGKIKNVCCLFVALSLVGLAGLCLWTRTGGFTKGADRAMLAAAALSIHDGGYSLLSVTDNAESTVTHTTSEGTIEETTVSHIVATPDENVFQEDPSEYEDLPQYPILETLYSEGDTSYNNFFIKNTTGLSLDVDKYLKSPLGFQYKASEEPQVLIVHTHTTESYMTYDTGYYHEGFYSRSSDKNKNVVRVGKAIADGLKAQGISVIHATEVHDSPQYTGAYSRSYETIQKYLELYPTIKVVLDIHRDSISYGSDGGKIKPTFTYNGNKAAQIMIMSGYDPDGSKDFPFWEENLAFALKLQDTAEQMYPGMTRPLYFGSFAYNMNVNNGSLLIEIGTDANTLSEAVYSGELLANVLTKVLQSS